MSAAGAVLVPVSVIFGETGQNAPWALVGAFLSVFIAVVLDLIEAIERMRGWLEHWRASKALRRKEKEARQANRGPLFDRPSSGSLSSAEPVASTTEPVSIYIPGKDDLPPEGGSPLRSGLRLVLEGITLMLRGLKEMVALVILIPWVAVFYMALSAAGFAIKPLMHRLGIGEETAEGVLIADLVLLVLTGAWLLTSVRTQKRSVPIRCLETGVLAGVLLLAISVAFAADNYLYALGPAVVGLIVYFKVFW